MLQSLSVGVCVYASKFVRWCVPCEEYMCAFACKCVRVRELSLRVHACVLDCWLLNSIAEFLTYRGRLKL